MTGNVSETKKEKDDRLNTYLISSAPAQHDYLGFYCYVDARTGNLWYSSTEIKDCQKYVSRVEI
jgi:hypothetical protein